VNKVEETLLGNVLEETRRRLGETTHAYDLIPTYVRNFDLRAVEPTDRSRKNTQTLRIVLLRNLE